MDPGEVFETPFDNPLYPHFPLKRVLSERDGAKVYFVSVVDGKVVERVLEPERIS